MQYNSNTCLGSELLDLEIDAFRLTYVIFGIRIRISQFQTLPDRFIVCSGLMQPIKLGGGGGGSYRHFPV